MASEDRKAPPTLWALATVYAFWGFYQFSSGLYALLNSVEFETIIFARLIIGIGLLAAGLLVCFVIATGKYLMLLVALGGLVLCCFRLNWVRFLFSTDSTAQITDMPLPTLIPAAFVCVSLIVYLLLNPSVAQAFKRAKAQKNSRLEQETLFV